MKFSETLSYPMSLDDLEAMSLDPEFLRSRFQRFTTGLEVAVEGRSIRASGLLNTDLLPGATKAFIAQDARLEFTETWSGEGEARTASSRLTATGAPLKVSISSTFSGGALATRVATGDLVISVPFFGSKLEQEGIARAGRILKEEQHLAAEYLEKRA